MTVVSMKRVERGNVCQIVQDYALARTEKSELIQIHKEKTGKLI